MEKAVGELEKYLCEYSRLADPDDLEDMSPRVEAASEEATRFTELIGELYENNEDYAPGLSGHEKATTDIKLFSAGYGITIVVISGGLLTELEKRKKPADTYYQEKAESLLV